MLSEGQQFLDEGRFEEALACFRDGDNLRSIFGRGVALQLLGRFEEAEAAYELVLNAAPQHRETLANLIAMNVEIFDLSRIELYARRLLEIDANAAVALQGLILVAVERRDFDQAANFFDRLSLTEEHFLREQALREQGRDAVEYRLSRQVVERLRDHHGPVAHPY